MKITVIDGQGGNVGRELAKRIAEEFSAHDLTVVGTNSRATETMLKSGVKRGATGENAVIVAARRSDVIVGPLGIVIADSLLGEVSPAMATAIGSSGAAKILLPLNRCDTLIAGVKEPSAAALIDDAMEKLHRIEKETVC